MKVYAGMDPRLPVGEAVAHARRVEALGYDGLHVAETVHDALGLSLVLAGHTERLTIRTSVALAFVRSPTLTAYAAWDVARWSNGRFELGLGTQIRQNIEDRYGVAWDDPVGRMGDYLGALRALFECFRTGAPLHYESGHYRLTRLQPYFNPGPDPDTVVPPLWLGGVNARICRLAGAVADGFVTHPTNSDPRYLTELCLPALAAGAAGAGRVPGQVTVVAGAQVVTGATPDEVAAERERQRRLLAFLYSTPAYRRTLDLYGWGELTGKLGELVRRNRWEDLAGVLTDEVLDTLAPSATFAELPGLLARRYGGLAQGVTLPVPADPAHDGAYREVVAALRAA